MTVYDDLAALVRQRREALRISQKAAAASVGMSAVTWNRVEVKGELIKPLSYAGVESALGWGSGSIRTFLDGGPAPESSDVVMRTDGGPRLSEATHDDLLTELRRRLAQASPEGGAHGRRPLTESPSPETPESVTARGMIPGRPMSGDQEAPERAHGGPL